jgi:opacity protein-like surface antigen
VNKEHLMPSRISAVVMYLGTAALVILVAVLFAACVSVPYGHAEGVASKSKVAAPQAERWSPYTPPLDSPPAASAMQWYVGAVGAYTWVPNEAQELGIGDTWSGGFVGGFLWRYGTLGMGVEGDYVVRDLGDFAIDDGIWSLRGRLGMFATEQTFVYLTGGIAGTTADFVPDAYSKGLVVGGGIEREIAKGLALRAEVLHYRHADDYFEWGDHGSNQARVGLVMKF